MRTTLYTIFVSVTLLAAGAAAAQETEIQWSTGVDFTSGKYSDTLKTEILYLPFSGKVLFGDFTAKVTVPYIRIKGPGTVVGGGEVGPITRDRVPNVITSQDGIGDVTASLSYTKYLQDNTLFVDLTGKVKIPTASSVKSLGTGEADYTAQIDVTKQTGDLNLFAAGGYRFMGSNDIFQLQNGFLASAGFSFDMAKKTSIGLIYDYRESASLTAANPSELTGFISWKLSKKIRLQTYGIIGFSKGSPDSGAGIQISFRP